jgi:methionine-R-sulfoxide reductase
MRAVRITALAASIAAIVVAVAAPPDKSNGADRPTPAAKSKAAVKAKETKMVKVYVFNDSGKLVGPVESPKLVLSDKQWRDRLTPEQYKILRAKGTERAFCGTLLDNKLEGVYACAGCGLPLFSSDAKFHSGTGWPSYFQPIAKENVAEHSDRSYGMERTEILCARCGGHLGHVFDDGPAPTGLRFCLNSESLKFTAQDKLKSLADPAAEAKPSTSETSTAEKTSEVSKGKK